MKSALILATALMAFSNTANARTSEFLERIPTLVKYLLSKDGEKVANTWGKEIKSGDDLTTGWAEHEIGAPSSGNAFGDWKFFRLVGKGKNGEGEILLDRSVGMHSGVDNTTYLYLFADLRNASNMKGISAQIDNAVKKTIEKLSRRIEAAAQDVRQNHPFPKMSLYGRDEWVWFDGHANGVEKSWSTSGPVYQIRIDQMDPAVLQEFLENIVNRIESMPHL